MKRVIEMVMVLALFAAVSAADNVPAEKKESTQKESVHKQAGHVCINSIFMQVGQLEKQGKDADAIKMLEDSKAKPEYESHCDQIYSKLQTLYGKTKQYDKNVALWNEGHKKNLIFDIDLSKDEFKPYEKVKGFAEVVKKDQELKKAKAAPQLIKEECEDHGKDEKKETK